MSTLLTDAQLKTAVDALEALISVQAGNDNYLGRWARFAAAVEQEAGAVTEANQDLDGYMLRAAVALESIAGTSGAEENDNRAGLLKRIVDALEVQAGGATEGSLGQRLATAAVNATFAPELQALALSVSSIAENSATGTVVGAINGMTSGSTLSITSQSNANWFAISGGNLTIGASSPDFETNAAPTVTVRETLAEATNSPRDTILTITVTDIVELSALTLSASSIAENSAAGTDVGTIQGTTSGSTLSILSQSNANWFALSGTTLEVGASSPDFETNAAPTVTIRETLAGAANTPRDTVLTITVTDVVENSSPSFVRSTATTGSGTSIAPAKPAVDGAGGYLLLAVNVFGVDGLQTVSCATPGWSKVTSVYLSNDECAMFRAAEGAAAPTVTIDQSATAIRAEMAYFKKASGGAMTSVTLKNNAGGNGTTATGTTFNTVGNYATAVYVVASAVDTAVGAPSAGFTEVVDGGDAGARRIAMGTLGIAVAGTASGSPAMSVGSGLWQVAMLELV